MRVSDLERWSSLLSVGATELLFLAAVVSSVAAQVTWTPVPMLSRRQHHAMAFDTARGKVVLFGGDSYGGLSHFFCSWKPG